eukprot:UN04289
MLTTTENLDSPSMLIENENIYFIQHEGSTTEEGESSDITPLSLPQLLTSPSSSSSFDDGVPFSTSSKTTTSSSRNASHLLVCDSPEQDHHFNNTNNNNSYNNNNQQQQHSTQHKLAFKQIATNVLSRLLPPTIGQILQERRQERQRYRTGARFSHHNIQNDYFDNTNNNSNHQIFPQHDQNDGLYLENNDDNDNDNDNNNNDDDDDDLICAKTPFSSLFLYIAWYTNRILDLVNFTKHYWVQTSILFSFSYYICMLYTFSIYLAGL